MKLWHKNYYPIRHKLKYLTMIKNYIKIAIRSLIKQKFYAALNIAGLSIGLCCFILIALYVNDEYKYDRHFSEAEQIYRMDFSGEIGGNTFVTSLSPAPAAKTLLNDFPEVLDVTRFRSTGNWLINKANSRFPIKIESAIWADKNIFSFFDLPLKYGDPEKSFQKPKTLALSASKAAAIFGEINPIGEIVHLDNDPDNSYEVTAVYEDLPENTHFHFEMLLNMEMLEESKSSYWLSVNFSTYIRLAKEANYKDLEAKFPEMAKKYFGQELEDLLNVDREVLVQANSPAKFSLYPMLDIHLNSNKNGELEANGDIKYVYIFTAIALFILLLACINFMNLATARSTKRAKEVGLRKVMGAHQKHLINQFLAEALVISALSTLIAIMMAGLLLSPFNELAGKAISDEVFLEPTFLVAIFTIIIIVGLLAGSYPAFYLSKFNPIETLKGKLNLGMKSNGIRSILVVFQFFISISVITGTAVIYDQLSYIQNKKLGFNKEHVVMVKDAWLLGNKINIFKDEVIKNTFVTNGTVAGFLPVNTLSNNNVFLTGSNPSSSTNYLLSNNLVDHDYIPTLGIEIAEGRNFSRDFISDSTGVILNETAVSLMQMDDPIGKYIYSFDVNNRETPTLLPRKIIGVMKDFHFSSLKNSIGPMLFELGQSTGYISFRVQGENLEKALSTIENKWDKISAGQPFDYEFLDVKFQELYSTELKTGNICGVFSVLAILIACLGLYGLAAFTTEQKTKEIGIRKVLGASITSIITLISKEFTKLISISFVMASVLTHYLMSSWLEDFEYRTDLKSSTFILGGAFALFIALLTMGAQSYKAAKMNPSKSLRGE